MKPEMKPATLVRRLVGICSAVLLVPIPAYALSFSTWNFGGAAPAGFTAWTNAGSTPASGTSGTSTLAFNPANGSVANNKSVTFKFTNTVVTNSGDKIRVIYDGKNPLIVSGVVTVRVWITLQNDPGSLDFYNNQFKATAPKTVTAPAAFNVQQPTGTSTFTALTRTLTVSFTFNPSANTATSWTATGPISITFGP